jgi:hypothetical protein
MNKHYQLEHATVEDEVQQLTPERRLILNEIIVAQLVKKFIAFYEPQGSF